jgi:hypothetical protein
MTGRVVVSTGECRASKSKGRMMMLLSQGFLSREPDTVTSVSLKCHVRLLTWVNLAYCHLAPFLGDLHENQN